MSQPQRGRAVRRIAALGLALGLLAPAAGPAAAADPLVLRVGTDQKLETLNPWHSITFADYEVFQLQYEMLVGFGPNLEAVPGFADEWASSDDKMTHTFHIREGMTWSDGTPATCEDARWTYQFVLDVQATENGYVGSGYLEPYLMNAGLKAVRCDGSTLTVETEFSTTLLTQAYVPILPKHIWSKYTVDQIGFTDTEGFFANEPAVVGSGPYVAVEWDPGVFIRFVRNERYWGKAGAPDEIILQTLADSDTMVQALKRGELDYVRGVAADQFDALAGQPDIVAVEGFSNGYTYLSFNTRATREGYNGSTSALEDVAFRDALGYAIDKGRLLEAVAKGHGEPGTTIVPPYHVKWHVEPDRPRTFDLAEANRRLDAAGYARNAANKRVDADGKEIVLRMTWPDSEDHSTDAQFIQGWFAELGIGVDPAVTEEATLYGVLYGPETGEYNADWDMYMWGWGGDPDPMSLLSWFTSDQIEPGGNDCFFANPRYDELFGLQQRAVDETQRHAYLAETQQLFHDQACNIPVYYDNELHAYRTDKFAGWVNQPPDTGTPIFGFGYGGYLALIDAASVTPPPTAQAETAAPSASDGEPTPAPSAAGGTSTGSDNALLVVLAVVAVVLVVVVGLVVARRRGEGRAAADDE